MSAENDGHFDGVDGCGGGIYINIEPTEKTTLLAKSLRTHYDDCNKSNYNYCISSLELYRNYCDFRLILIVIMLIGGFSIATYQLVTEYRFPNVKFSLDLINRDVWCRTALSLGKQLNTTNIFNVIIIQTGDHQCLDSDSCFQYLIQLQRTYSYNASKENSIIPYNFMIGDDGQTYEVQGWDHENGFEFISKPSSLVIGLIGNYTFKMPSADQLNSVDSLINESIRRRKLQNDYQLYGVRNLTISHVDGEELFKAIYQRKNFKTLLKVL